MSEDGTDAIEALLAAKAGEPVEPEAPEDTAGAGTEVSEGAESSEAGQSDASGGADEEVAAGSEDGATGEDAAREPESDDGDAGGEEAPEEESVAPDENSVEYWRELAAKEEKRRRDMQAHKDREVAEARAKLEAYEELMGQVSEAVGEDEPGPAANRPDPEQLEAWVQNAPVDAFQTVLANDQALMPDVIALITEHHGAKAGATAQASYLQAMQMSMAQQQAEQERQKAEAAEAETAKAEAASTAESYMQSKYGEQYVELRADVAKEVQRITGDESLLAEAKKIHGDNASSFLEAVYNDVWREKMTSTIAAQNQKEPVPEPGFSETGGGARVEEPEPSYADEKAAKFAAVIRSQGVDFGE